jgi:hypothetical protein
MRGDLGVPDAGQEPNPRADACVYEAAGHQRLSPRKMWVAHVVDHNCSPYFARPEYRHVWSKVQVLTSETGCDVQLLQASCMCPAHPAPPLHSAMPPMGNRLPCCDNACPCLQVLVPSMPLLQELTFEHPVM